MHRQALRHAMALLANYSHDSYEAHVALRTVRTVEQVRRDGSPPPCIPVSACRPSSPRANLEQVERLQPARVVDWRMKDDMGLTEGGAMGSAEHTGAQVGGADGRYVIAGTAARGSRLDETTQGDARFGRRRLDMQTLNSFHKRSGGSAAERSASLSKSKAADGSFRGRPSMAGVSSAAGPSFRQRAGGSFQRGVDPKNRERLEQLYRSGSSGEPGDGCGAAAPTGSAPSAEADRLGDKSGRTGGSGGSAPTGSGAPADGLKTFQSRTKWLNKLIESAAVKVQNSMSGNEEEANEEARELQQRLRDDNSHRRRQHVILGFGRDRRTEDDEVVANIYREREEAKREEALEHKRAIQTKFATPKQQWGHHKV